MRHPDFNMTMKELAERYTQGMPRHLDVQEQAERYTKALNWAMARTGHTEREPSDAFRLHNELWKVPAFRLQVIGEHAALKKPMVGSKVRRRVMIHIPDMLQWDNRAHAFDRRMFNTGSYHTRLPTAAQPDMWTHPGWQSGEDAHIIVPTHIFGYAKAVNIHGGSHWVSMAHADVGILYAYVSMAGTLVLCCDIQKKPKDVKSIVFTMPIGYSAKWGTPEPFSRDLNRENTWWALDWLGSKNTVFSADLSRENVRQTQRKLRTSP